MISGSAIGGAALGEHPAGPPKKHVPVEPGSYKNAVVILLTDGQTNAGYDPVDAARMAGEYGVRVYTVGFGTTRGNIVGFGGFTMRAQLDEESLKKIADMTRARYFHATSAEDLKAVYNVLSRQLVVETREMEITAFFASWPPCACWWPSACRSPGITASRERRHSRNLRGFSVVARPTVGLAGQPITARSPKPASGHARPPRNRPLRLASGDHS